MGSTGLSDLSTAEPRRRAGDLLWPLALHSLFFVLYAVAVFFATIWAANSFTLDSSDTEFGDALFVAGWLTFVAGPIWLVLGGFLIRWWRQQRQGLVRRTIAWDSLLWLGVFLLLFLPWKKTRRLLIPPRKSG